MGNKTGKMKNQIEISDGNKEEKLGEQKELGSMSGIRERESGNRERT